MKNDEYLFIDDLFFLRGLLEARIDETKERLLHELDQAVPNHYLIYVFANDLEYFSVLHDKLTVKILLSFQIVSVCRKIRPFLFSHRT